MPLPFFFGTEEGDKNFIRYFLRHTTAVISKFNKSFITAL